MYDVREKMSQTAFPLGSAEIKMGVIEESQRLRVPLQSNTGSAGFLTILHLDMVTGTRTQAFTLTSQTG